MKSIILIILSILFTSSCLVGQEYQPVTIKAGTRVKDYFPLSQRYMYERFTEGKAIFKNQIITPSIFNYNYLTGEMEFIQTKDTLFFALKKDINFIVVARDTFYYHEGYLQMIHSGPLRVYIKQYYAIKNILKQGAMGTVNRSAASESYEYVFVGQRSIDLKPVDDMILQRTDEYYFSVTGDDFIPFNKRNILRSLSGKGDEIKDFIKSNKVNFESREDLLKLADFVSRLPTGNPTKR